MIVLALIFAVLAISAFLIMNFAFRNAGSENPNEEIYSFERINLRKNGSFTFEGDNIYRVEITLTADKGTRFAVPLEEEFVNGKDALVSAYNGDSSKGIVLTVSFDRLPYIIDTVDIAVSVPVEGMVGESFYSPWIYTGYTSVYAYDWYKGDERLYYYDSFEAGETYKLKVRLATIKKFSENVIVYVNEIPVNVLSVDYDNTMLLFETYFEIPSDKPNVLYGDVDGNEKVNVLDANLVRRYAAKLIDFTEEQLAAADVDGNGKVNVLDANLIRRYAAKLIDKFPAEE